MFSGNFYSLLTWFKYSLKVIEIFELYIYMSVRSFTNYLSWFCNSDWKFNVRKGWIDRSSFNEIEANRLGVAIFQVMNRNWRKHSQRIKSLQLNCWEAKINIDDQDIGDDAHRELICITVNLMHYWSIFLYTNIDGYFQMQLHGVLFTTVFNSLTIVSWQMATQMSSNDIE